MSKQYINSFTKRLTREKSLKTQLTELIFFVTMNASRYLKELLLAPFPDLTIHGTSTNTATTPDVLYDQQDNKNTEINGAISEMAPNAPQVTMTPEKTTVFRLMSRS